MSFTRHVAPYIFYLFFHWSNKQFRCVIYFVFVSIQTIHNSGILTGAFMNNGAVRCGSTVCNQVSKVFTENPLPNGYYNIATIPAGASNISILELKNSDNYLGTWENINFVRKYIHLQRKKKINFVTQSHFSKLIGSLLKIIQTVNQIDWVIYITDRVFF